MKVEIGQKLYREYKAGNQQPVQIQEFTVTSLGRKYFYCNGNDSIPFSCDELKHINKNYSQSNIQLYLSEKCILDKREQEKLVNMISQAFEYKWRSSYSLDQLRQVVEILNLK